MADVTVANVKKGVIGDLRYALGTLTLSTAYAAGGDVLRPSMLGMRSILGCFVQSFTDLGAPAGAGGAKNLKVVPVGDGTVKIKGFTLATNVEITAAPTDQSAITGVPFVAFGKS